MRTRPAMARVPGVSFIVRARNEEKYLAASLASLKGVTVPHEIVVILHMCTDRSRDIAEAAAADGQPVKVVIHDRPVSRAGFETLATPETHPASLPSFCNMCYSHQKHVWAFKWDADFVATSELLAFLNTSLDVGNVDTAIAYQIPCVLDEHIVNTEFYLTNAVGPFVKRLFWEVSTYRCTTPLQWVQLPCKIMSIPPTVLKEYWKEAPWFAAGVDPEVDAAYATIVCVLGAEPPGLARASNPEFSAFIGHVYAHMETLTALGISENQ